MPLRPRVSFKTLDLTVLSDRSSYIKTGLRFFSAMKSFTCLPILFSLKFSWYLRAITGNPYSVLIYCRGSCVINTLHRTIEKQLKLFLYISLAKH